MVQPTSDLPQLSEVLQWVIEQKLSEMFVALPARVDDYDSSDQTVKVTPLIKLNMQTIDGGDLLETLPILHSVPVLFPRGGGFSLTYPLKKNDKVLLVFNDRNIDQYMRQDSGDPVDPLDYGAHTLNGAVAIPGFFPTNESIKESDASNTDMIIGKEESGIKLRIKDSSINIEHENKSEEKAVLANKLEVLLNNIEKAFINHIHPTGTGPSGAPVPGPTPSVSYLQPAGTTDSIKFDPNIKSNKLTLPDN